MRIASLSLAFRVFERRTATGSRLLSVRAKSFRKTNSVTSRHVKGEQASFPVDVRGSKTSFHKFSN